MQRPHDDDAMLSPAKINIELSAEEALVLFEWLARFKENPEAPPPVVGTPEENVLWRVQAQLEKQLVEPFDPGYEAFLNTARAKVGATSADE